MTTLPASGNISLSQIYTAFNAPLNTPFTTFLKGGTYVTTTASIANITNIPTVVPINITNFYGTGTNYISGVSRTNLIAAYTGESYIPGSGKWYDCSGNGNTATVSGGTVTVTKPTNFGGRSAVSGTTATTVTFPSGIINSTTSLLHLCKYNGGVSRRILNGVGGNWLSGFWNGASGVAYHEGWITQYATDWSTAKGSTGYANNWLLSTDINNAINYIYNYNANGVGLTLNNGGAQSTASYPIAINNDGETSDWSMACLLVYNAAGIPTAPPRKWIADTYGIANYVATTTTTTIATLVAGTTSRTLNLHTLAENCIGFTYISKPAWISLGITSGVITVTGDLSSSVSGTVSLVGYAANNSRTFITLNVSQTLSDPTVSIQMRAAGDPSGQGWNYRTYNGLLSGLGAAAQSFFNDYAAAYILFFNGYVTVIRTDNNDILVEGQL